MKEWGCTLVTWRDVAPVSPNYRRWRVRHAQCGGGAGMVEPVAGELWIRLLCAWLRAGRPRAEQRGAGVGGWARRGTESTLRRWRTYPTTSICRKLSGMLQRLTLTRIVCPTLHLNWTPPDRTTDYRDYRHVVSVTLLLSTELTQQRQKCALEPVNLKRKPDIVTRFLFSIY